MYRQKSHTVSLARLRPLSRNLSKKKKGSRNRKKAKANLVKLHARISNIRKDALHQLTTDFVQRFRTICT